MAALPLTSGYYSKHDIVFAAVDYEHNGFWFWFIAVAASLMTGLYTFRLIFVTFFGKPLSEHADHAKETVGLNIKLPLIILAVLSIVGGWIPLPFAHIFPALSTNPHAGWVNGFTTAAPIAGIALAWWFFHQNRNQSHAIVRQGWAVSLRRFWFSGWGFDWLYQTLLVTPFMWLTRINKDDVVDAGYTLIALIARGSHQLLSQTQTGRVQWYAAGIALGVIVIVGLGVFA